jgi:ceramide glucosyltransferase
LQDANDPAYKVAQKVKDRNPECDITVLVEHCSAGLNPKVNNLMPACERAKYEQILISDSNVMVGKDYLKETARHMRDPHVGLVTNIIRGIRARSLGSLFENLHLNSFIIGSVCFLDQYLHMPCVIGKSMLMRKRP